MARDREAALARAYERARPRLVRIAYATLGSHAEAEDIVSDCWSRLVTADGRESILDVDAWATVVVARAALDSLRSARHRREHYIGPWLPEPLISNGTAVVGANPDSADDPAERVSLDDQISYALLVVLETLTPAERTSWVLHDLFGMSFSEVADSVGRTPAAVRQLAARARVHVNARVPRVAVTPIQHDAAVRSFLAAVAGGDLSALLSSLDSQVVYTSDGGGKVTAARRPVVGADNVVRFLQGLITNFSEGQRVQTITVNGRSALGIYDSNGLNSVLTLTLDGDRITRIDMIRAPDKLRHLGSPT